MSRTKTIFGICCLFYIFLNPNSSFGQEKIITLRGKVQNLSNDVSNVLVVNLNSKKSTITDSVGLFSIAVRLRDTVRFTAVQYLTKEIIVADASFNENLVVINLVENIINLNEVTVTPYNLTGRIDLDVERLGIEPVVTSSKLGLPNANVEIMTQSERLLLEADRGKYVRLATIEDRGKLLEVLGYATLSVIINTHKIMNRASGRTKSLQERVARDENMAMEEEIIAKFSKKTISQNFDIPEANIDGFLTYCLFQKDFSKLSNAGNTDEIWEYLKTKSSGFKETDVLKE